MNGLKVLMVQCLSGMSGGAMVCIKLAQGLRQRGLDPILVFPEPGPAVDWSRSRGVPTRVCPSAYWFRGFQGDSPRLRVRSSLRFLRGVSGSVASLCRLMEEEGAQVVLANTCAALGGAMAAKRAGLPLVWHVHECIDAATGLGRAQVNFVKRHADSLVAVSDYAGRVFGNSPKLRTVYNGIDLPPLPPPAGERQAFRAKWSLADDDPVVALVGNISLHKGSFFFARLIPDILRLEPRAKFVYIGNNPADTQRSSRGLALLRRVLGRRLLDLRSDLAGLGIKDAVRLAGWEPEVWRALSAVDLVVFPSMVAEGFGLPLVEAGAAERPVVGFRTGPGPELVRDGETGILVPVGDGAAMTRAVVDLLRNPGQASAMGRAGRQYVERRFSMQSHLDQMEQVLAGAAALGPGGKPAPSLATMLRQLLTPTRQVGQG